MILQHCAICNAELDTGGNCPARYNHPPAYTSDKTTGLAVTGDGALEPRDLLFHLREWLIFHRETHTQTRLILRSNWIAGPGNDRRAPKSNLRLCRQWSKVMDGRWMLSGSSETCKFSIQVTPTCC